jgi:hypothetical protein
MNYKILSWFELMNDGSIELLTVQECDATMMHSEQMPETKKVLSN